MVKPHRSAAVSLFTLSVLAVCTITFGVAPAVQAAPVKVALAVTSPPGPRSITGGGSHVCVLTAVGGGKCWGYNLTGGVGDGTTTSQLAPVDVSGFTSGLSSIAAGGQTTCAVTDGGGAKCWGWNGDGQVGDGTSANRLTPVDVSGLTAGVSAVSVGYFHACAVTTGGGVKCWGSNDFGQLGDGTNSSSSTPVDVSGLTTGVTAIATGLGDRDHTCALTAVGGVKCWGANNLGQLGDGTTSDRSTPVDVAGLTSGVSAIYAGGMHTCAVMTGGGAKCWGDNDGGQLGDGTTTTRLTPVDVSGLTSGVATMALSQSSFGYGSGRSHTCAVTTDGGVKCWGRNAEGEAGDGTAGNNRLTPVDVVGLSSGAVSVATTFWLGCAVKSDGAVKCWGWTGAGDGTSLQRLTPVDVSGSFFRPECPTLLAAPHTSFSMSDGYAVGSVATFGADPGFGLVGGSTLTCQGDTTWDGSVPTAASSGAVAVVPDTGLDGGDVVNVVLSGFAPLASLGWAQCIPLQVPTVDDCSPPIGLGQADGTGALTAPVRLQRFIYVPAAGRWVDCANPVETCVIGASDTTDVAGTAVVAPLSFATPPDPPTVRGTIALTPPSELSAGDPVTVTGSGFRPDSFVEVHQCVADPVDPSACNRSVASTTTDGTGGFTVDIVVAQTVAPPGGSPTDCFSAGTRCAIAGAEAVDFPGTVATAAIVVPPTVLPGGASVTEGDSGTVLLQVPVTLSGPSNVAVTVEWTTIFDPGWSSVAAQPGVDYDAASGVVTFAPGETAKTVAVTVHGDLSVELDELLAVSFHNQTNAKMGGFWGLGFGGIRNDDVIPIVLPGGASVTEGNAGTVVIEVPVTLSRPSALAVTVEWATIFDPSWSSQAAEPGVDYDAASGVVTFAPGETAKTVAVTVHGDLSIELDELLAVSFHNQTNAKMGGFWGLGFGGIANDD